MIKKHIIYPVIALFACLHIFTACEDTFEYGVPGNIPEGYSEVAFNLNFKEFTPALNSRTAGDAIKTIDQLWVVIYDEDDNLYLSEEITASHGLSTSVSSNTRPDGKPSAEDATGRASFRMLLPNGRYKMYAVANYDPNTEGNDISSPDKLRSLKIWWNADTIQKNNQMFGQFYNVTTDNSGWDGDSNVVVNGKNTKLHAWLRRCASKVTVAFDGTNLKDGVSIYLMSTTIKDIPINCKLGDTNTPQSVDSIIPLGERIMYCEGNEDISSDNFINNYPATVSNKPEQRYYGSNHSDAANALFFYENMQGVREDVDKTQKDKDNDGKPDYADRLKDDVPYGTYIEVEGIYRSTNPERPGSGLIKFRFMLGKDIYHDFNAERNHHYRLTLRFKNFANDYDWHIDYTDNVLEVTEPLVFDYRGMVFEGNDTDPNRGHVFSASNVVTVTSYMENAMGQLEDYVITYDDGDTGNFKSTSDWLQYSGRTDGSFPYEKNVSFTVKPTRSDVVPIDIDNTLQTATQKGTATQPYNLANPTQGAIAPASAIVQNSANCYIVDAPGYYLIPAVYGNAITNGAKYKPSYEVTATASRAAATKILSGFQNHLGKPISEPYIVDNAGCNPVRACPILQDENNLLTYDVWAGSDVNENVKYIPGAYGGKGGIQFYIDRANIKQGNAIIGLFDKPMEIINGSGSLPVPNNLYALWSWHIWVTSLAGINEEDHTIQVTSYKDPKQSQAVKYDFFPMNLGWCSNHGDIVKYYPERKCRVKFSSANGKEKTILIVQKSHIAFTCGNNTYYQWGRKDPFFGALNNTTDHNKPRYMYSWWSDAANYGVLNGNAWSDDGRKTTVDALADRILYPYLWHNPPRKGPGYNDNQFQSENITYTNLWGNQGIDDMSSVKTVYDPCPVGFMVPHCNMFSGFTTNGDNAAQSNMWMNALKSNVSDYDTESNQWTATPWAYTTNTYELYTSLDKTQSIVFPVSGYRDWDNSGYAFQYGEIGFSWSSVECLNADVVSGKAEEQYDTHNDWAFNCDFAYDDVRKHLRPKDIFFSCDGFPVRPVKIP